MLTALSVMGWSQNTTTDFNTRETREHDASRTESLRAAFLNTKAKLNSKTTNRGSAEFPLWVSFYDALEGAGIAGVTAFPFVFPDTLPVIAVSGDPFQMSVSSAGFAYAVAQTFHPSNPVYAAGYDDEGAFSPNSAYTVDSMRFYYAYTRNTADSIIDTLRVHLINQSVNNIYTVNGSTDDDPSIVILTADTPGHTPLNPHTTVEILLDSSMVTPDNILSVESIDLRGITLGKDEKITVAIEYIPGSTYSLGDTLIAADGVTPATPINYIQIGSLDEEEGGEMISQTLVTERNWNMASMRNPYFHESWDEYYVSAPIYETSTFFQVEQLLMDFYISEARFPEFIVSKECKTITCGNTSSLDAKSVTWSFGDENNNQKLGESVEFTYNDYGSYDVQMTVKENGTNATFSLTKRISLVWDPNATCNVGIEEVEDLVSLGIYPNPANNNLNVNVKLKNKETINVAILDMHGRVVYTDELNSNGFNKTIDVSNFATGLYQVRVIAGENTISNSVQIGK